jgi:hypothetical protein
MDRECVRRANSDRNVHDDNLFLPATDDRRSIPGAGAPAKLPTDLRRCTNVDVRARSPSTSDDAV